MWYPLTQIDFLGQLYRYEHLTVLTKVKMSSSRSLGFTCWLTGLSGAGKSTIAIEIANNLHQISVPCEYLDGDIIRTNLSKGLGFSREDRDINVLRVGFVCSLLNKHGISAVVAMISPYRQTREELRRSVPNFVEIHVETPLEICIERDPKGLYKKALSKEIPDFTGISSPYEVPENPELTLKTDNETVDQCVYKVLKYLDSSGFIPKY